LVEEFDRGESPGIVSVENDGFAAARDSQVVLWVLGSDMCHCEAGRQMQNKAYHEVNAASDVGFGLLHINSSPFYGARVVP